MISLFLVLRWISIMGSASTARMKQSPPRVKVVFDPAHNHTIIFHLQQESFPCRALSSVPPQNAFMVFSNCHINVLFSMHEPCH